MFLGGKVAERNSQTKGKCYMNSSFMLQFKVILITQTLHNKTKLYP